MATFLSVDRWKQAVTINPDDTYAWFYLGLSYLSAKNIGDAYKALEKAVKMDPYNAPAHFVLGIVYALGGEYKFSMKEWEKAVTIDPNVYNKLLAKSEIRGVIEQYVEEALRRYKREIDYNPNNIEAYLNMGKALLFLGRYEASLQYLRRVTELKPDFWDAYTYLGMAYNKMGQYQLAIANLKRAITVNPKFAEGYFALGELYISLGNPALALRAFEKAVELEPSNARYLTSLGKALQLIGNNLAAMRAFQKAIELNPRSKWPHFYLAQALEQEFQYDLAFEEYKKALELDPKFEEVYAHIGKLAKNMGKYEEAIEYLKKAYEANPMDYDILFELATAYQGIGKIDEALKTFEELLKIAPNLSHAWLHYGKLLLQKGDLEKAKNTFKKLLELMPKYNEAYIILAKIYLQEGNYSEALELLKTAYKNNPSLKESLWLMVDAYLGLGKYQEALEHLNLYIERFGETKEAILKKAEIYDKLDNVEGKVEVYQKLLTDYKVETPEIIREAVKVYKQLSSYKSLAYQLAKKLRTLSEDEEDILLLLETAKEVDKISEVEEEIEIIGKELLKKLDEVEESPEIYEEIKDKLWILEELAEIYARRGHLKEAMDIYRKLVNLTEDSKYQLRLAELYAELNFVTEALQCARKAHRDERLHEKTYKLLTKLYFKLEFYDDVVKYAEEYIKKYKIDEEIGGLLVEALINLGRLDEAKEHLEKLLETPSPYTLLLYALVQASPEGFRAQVSKALNLAKKLLSLGDIDESYYIRFLEKLVLVLAERGDTDLLDPLLEELLNLAPTKIHLLTEVIDRLEKLEKFEDAIRVAKLAQLKAKEVNEVELYEKFKEKAKNLEDKLTALQQFKQWLMRADEQLLELERLLNEDKLDTAKSYIETLSRENEELASLPQFTYLRAILELKERRYDRAAYYLLKSIDSALDRSDILGHSLVSKKLQEISDKVDLSEIRKQIELEKKAEEKLKLLEAKQEEEEVKVTAGLKRSIKSLEKLAQSVLEQNGEDIEGEEVLDDLYIRAVNAYEAFEYEFAEAYLKEYLTKNPDDVTARLYLARTYYQLEDYESSSKIYSNLELENLEPDDMFYYIDSLIQTNRLDEALEILNNNSVKLPIVDSLKALVLAKKGDLKPAITLIKKLLKKNPRDWLNLYALALVSYKLKKYGEAIKHIKLAQKRVPSNFRLLEELVDFLLTQGDKLQAIAVCQNALKYIKPYYKAKGLLIRALIKSGDIERAMKEWEDLQRDEGVPAYYKARLKALFEG